MSGVGGLGDTCRVGVNAAEWGRRRALSGWYVNYMPRVVKVLEWWLRKRGGGASRGLGVFLYAVMGRVSVCPLWGEELAQKFTATEVRMRHWSGGQVVALTCVVCACRPGGRGAGGFEGGGLEGKGVHSFRATKMRSW